MPHNRYFLDTHFQKPQDVTLDSDQAHHLIRVMRAEVGQTVELVNGQNQWADARITHLEKKQAHLTLETVETSAPPPQKILCQALPRFSHLELIVEKGTELGMTTLRLFPGKLSEQKQLSAQRMLRLHSLSIAAMKQCGRFDLPKIEIYPPLEKWTSQDLLPLACYGDMNPKAPYLRDLPTPPNMMIIGPESGFHPSEIKVFEKLKVKGVRLHSNILRAETAALVALALS